MVVTHEAYDYHGLAAAPGRPMRQRPRSRRTLSDAAPAQRQPNRLAYWYRSYAEQTESVTLGMWLFLVTEVMFFGGLFMAYMLYRTFNPRPSPRRATRSTSASARSTPSC